jgi:hypothetical protein
LGQGWTPDTFSAAVIEDLIAWGLPEKEARDPGLLGRLRFSSRIGEPEWFDMYLVSDKKGKGGVGVLRVGGSGSGAISGPQPFKLGYESSSESDIQLVTGISSMEELFGSLSFAGVGGIEREVRTRAALEKLFVSTGEEFLLSREFLGYKPDARRSSLIRRRLGGDKTAGDDLVFGPFSSVGIKPKWPAVVDKALELVDPKVHYGKRSPILREVYDGAAIKFGTAHGIPEDRMTDLLFGSTVPSDEIVFIRPGGGGREGPPEMLTERQVFERAKAGSQALIEKRVGRALQGLPHKEIFRLWFEGGLLPEESKK